MSEAPRKTPYVIDEQPGKKHWCACGGSKNKPYCDGSHKGTGISPLLLIIDEPKKIAYCGCGQSGNKPLCDGSHSKL